MEWIKEHKFYIIAAIAASLFFLYSTSAKENELAEGNMQVSAMNGDEFSESKEEPADAEEPVVMMADIKGAVARPGVYKIQEGNRVIDLIELAGGLAKDADAASINFAMHVEDEMVIYVPRAGEQVDQTAAAVAQIDNGHESGKEMVNLNKAEASDLEALPGIGPSKAEAIIAYREENGPFKSIEDLKSISGIGDKTFEKLKELISVK